MTKFLVNFFFMFVMSLHGFSCMAQSDSSQTKSEKKIKTEFSTEMNSAYVWRGMYNDPKPNIQPSFSIAYKDFSIGVFGSNNLDNTYREFDSYISYSLAGFVVTLNDYFCDFSKSYSDYGDKSPHLIDLTLEYEIGDVHQFSALASSIVYGDDKQLKYNISSKNIQNYSTYLQTSYTFNVDHKSFSFLIGGTTHNGMYANKLNITNIGFEFAKESNLSSLFNYTPKFGLWINPYNNLLLFNCGIEF